jgi:hypothetical protein
LHLYIPDELAAEIRRRAKTEGVSVSRYLADLVARQVPAGWPKDFFRDIVGGWVGARLTRPPQPELERRDRL